MELLSLRTKSGVLGFITIASLFLPILACNRSAATTTTAPTHLTPTPLTLPQLPGMATIEAGVENMFEPEIHEQLVEIGTDFLLYYDCNGATETVNLMVRDGGGGRVAVNWEDSSTATSGNFNASMGHDLVFNTACGKINFGYAYPIEAADLSEYLMLELINR